jgi:hypothetical protein
MDSAVWQAIWSMVRNLMADGSLGVRFPKCCWDCSAVVGTDSDSFYSVLAAEHPEIHKSIPHSETPPTAAILDLLEFTHSHIGKPIPGESPSCRKPRHLTFDIEAGQAEFTQRINTLFARNGIAYELTIDGKVTRLATPVLREALSACEFPTGDATLNALLSSARAKFLNPDPLVRREALEKLWDAWERMKTIETGSEKRAQADALLDLAADDPPFRNLLAKEAKAISDVGNHFHIRHWETNRSPIERDSHVDYLFHRLLSLLHLLLKERAKKGAGVA